MFAKRSFASVESSQLPGSFALGLEVTPPSLNPNVQGSSQEKFRLKYFFAVRILLFVIKKANATITKIVKVTKNLIDF